MIMWSSNVREIEIVLGEDKEAGESGHEREGEDENKGEAYFTVSMSLLHPAARIGSPGFKPTA
jgi:hypothetical protein